MVRARRPAPTCAPSSRTRAPAAWRGSRWRRPRFVDRWGIDVPPRPALHDARDRQGAEGRHRPRPHVLRPSRVAREGEGGGVQAGDPRRRQARRRHRVRQRADRPPSGRAPRSAVPRARRPARRRPRPLPSRRRRRRRVEESTCRRCAEVGVRPPYVAFWGTLEPRKDVATLVAAFDRIAGDHPDLQLAVGGGSGWGNDRFEAAVAGEPPRRPHRAHRLPARRRRCPPSPAAPRPSSTPRSRRASASRRSKRSRVAHGRW